jgi:hypothetical protein
LHKIRLNIQGNKHRTYLQDKHSWSNEVWDSIKWKELKGAFLSLGPLKQIKTSKSIHGWLNMGRQKSKISPDAVDAHKCPQCLQPNETQEHILKCPHTGAHKRRYELVCLMMTKIIQNPSCGVQQVFESYVRSWLADSEPPTPDISRVPIKQRELLVKALEEQEQIGWDLGIRSYLGLTRHWSLAVAANPRLPPKNDKGKAWTRKAISELWNFSSEMWEH